MSGGFDKDDVLVENVIEGRLTSMMVNKSEALSLL